MYASDFHTSQTTLNTLNSNLNTVQASIPTNTNQLTNGAGFITSNGTAKTISDTLPVSKGGTGATTAANARTNLGLGNASTYSATTSVTNGSSALVTSGAVYTAVENAKSLVRNGLAGGRVSCGNISANSAYVGTVTFTEKMSSNVTVVGTVNHTYTDIIRCTVYNVGSSGFTFRVYVDGNVGCDGVYFNWIAMDYSNL